MAVAFIDLARKIKMEPHVDKLYKYVTIRIRFSYEFLF